jgi:ribosomal protein S18 acetylase RimI-like enzyme
MFHKDLGNGYTIREMTDEEFDPHWKQHAAAIFAENSIDFMWAEHISDQERSHLKELGKNMGSPLEINLGVFKGNEFAGWSTGYQHFASVYYMRNSAVLPAHRRQGLYTELLKAKLEMLQQRGFQKIYSRHVVTNNAVIIPKLKAGFIITCLELDDMFGTLVHLAYYTNPLRRNVMDFRAGALKPDTAMKKMLGME